MRKIQKLFIVLFTLVFCFGISTIPAFAASVSQDGLEVTLVTDKTAYEQDEQITATLSIKNTNEYDLENISVQSIIPEGYVLVDGSVAQNQWVYLGAGKTESIIIVLETDKSVQDNNEFGAGVITDVDQTNSGGQNDANKQITDVSIPDTGNYRLPLAVVLCCLLIGGIVMAYFAFKKKAGKKTMSAILCVVLSVTMLAGVPVQIYAADSKVETVAIQTTVKVNGKDVNLRAIVSYQNLPDQNYHNVSYDLVISEYVKNVKAFDAVAVVDGEPVDRPEDPVAVLGEFDGWYSSAKCEEQFDFSQPITQDTVIYAKWSIDETDTDGDGLYDVLENYIGTDLNNPDTDFDGLTDRFELELGTDPLQKDSDSDSVLDYDEDADEDGLSNGDELKLGTNATQKDTDLDGLYDADEVNIYTTDPTNNDSDGDGAEDGWEVNNGFDPLVFNASFTVEQSYSEVSDANSVSAAVELEVSGNEVDTVNVEPVDVNDSVLLTSAIPGYLGQAYDFSVDAEFDTAELKFSYDTKLGTIGEDFQPRIYYFNEQKGTMEELPNQTVTDGLVCATVTHFSTYILLNKVEFDKVWEEEIKKPITDGNDGQVTKIDVVFVTDTSGSMSGSRISTAKSAIRQFLDALRDEDQAALVSFDDTSQVLCTLTDDKDSVNSAVDDLWANGGTAMYTGLEEALRLLMDSSVEYGYKMVVMLSDGYDSPSVNFSTKYQPLINTAVENNIIVYTIGTGSSDTSVLTRIAEGTGGKYYAATQTDDILNVFEEIQGDTVDLTIDSNGDQIPDYFNDLIASGKLVLSTGAKSFRGIDFNYDKNGNPSDDYDGDGLKNGQELQVYFDEDTGRVYLIMISDPTLKHSDNDGVDDYTEIKQEQDPLVNDYFYYQNVQRLLGDHHFYYEENFVDDYDEDWIYRIDTSVVATLTGVWNTTKIYRNLILDYLNQYGEAAASVQQYSQDQVLNIYLDNIDRMLGVADKLYDVIGDLKTVKEIVDKLTSLKNLLRGGSAELNVVAQEYYECVYALQGYTDDLKVLVIKQPKLSSTTKKALKTSAMKNFDFNSLNVSLGMDVLGGAIDIFQTINTFAELGANFSLLNYNMGFLEHMESNGSRKNVQYAAEDIIDALGDGFGDRVASALKDDVIELSINMAITLVSCNPYVGAVTFAISIIDLITGLSDKTERAFKMLCYDAMSDSLRSIIIDLVVSTPNAYMYYFDPDNMLYQYLVHLAQIRILGEKTYIDFCTEGASKKFHDEDLIKQSVTNNINWVKEQASALNLKLSYLL